MFMNWRQEEAKEEKINTHNNNKHPAVRRARNCFSACLFMAGLCVCVCVWCADFFCYMLCLHRFRSCNAESLIYSPIFSNYNKLCGVFFCLHCLLFRCVYVEKETPCFCSCWGNVYQFSLNTQAHSRWRKKIVSAFNCVSPIYFLLRFKIIWAASKMWNLYDFHYDLSLALTSKFMYTRKLVSGLLIGRLMDWEWLNWHFTGVLDSQWASFVALDTL